MVLGASLALFACGSPEPKAAEMSEQDAVESINKSLDDAKKEVKDISDNIDSKLDEALKKIEDEKK